MAEWHNIFQVNLKLYSLIKSHQQSLLGLFSINFQEQYTFLSWYIIIMISQNFWATFKICCKKLVIIKYFSYLYEFWKYLKNIML